MNAEDRALAALERRSINPPERESNDDKPFLELDERTQLAMITEYLGKHPRDISDVLEYLSMRPPQEIATVMLHGNPREIHVFHQQHFIEYFAPRVQRAIDNGEIV